MEGYQEIWLVSLNSVWSYGTFISIVAALLGSLAGLSFALIDTGYNANNILHRHLRGWSPYIVLLPLFVPAPLVGSTMSILASKVFESDFTQGPIFSSILSLPYMQGLSFLVFKTYLEHTDVCSNAWLFCENSRRRSPPSVAAIASSPIRKYLWGISCLSLFLLVLRGKLLEQDGYKPVGAYLAETLTNAYEDTGKLLSVLALALLLGLACLCISVIPIFLHQSLAKKIARSAIPQNNNRTYSAKFHLVRWCTIIGTVCALLNFALVAVIMLRLLGIVLPSPFESALISTDLSHLSAIIRAADIPLLGAFVGVLPTIAYWMSTKHGWAKEVSKKHSTLLILATSFVAFFPSTFLASLAINFIGPWSGIALQFSWGFLGGGALSALLLSGELTEKKSMRYVNLCRNRGKVFSTLLFLREYKLQVGGVLLIAILHNAFDSGFRAKLAIQGGLAEQFTNQTGGGWSPEQRFVSLTLVIFLTIVLWLLNSNSPSTGKQGAV